ncbi:hypothetical protein PV318_03325 [Streptomyces sp. ME02-6991-2B]|nr:hypothetical protein [Streptomyces sp. ME02-6991-2B]
MPRFRAGQRLTAGALNAVLPLTAYKTTTTARTSTTALTADPDLFVNLPSDGATYAIEAFLSITGPVISSAGGISVGLSYSGTQVANSGTWIGQGIGTSSTSSVNFAGQSITGAGQPYGTNGGNFGVVLLNGLISPATAGSLAVVWAQATSNATPTNVRFGSWLKLTRLDT